MHGPRFGRAQLDGPHPTRLRRATFSREREKGSLARRPGLTRLERVQADPPGDGADVGRDGRVEAAAEHGFVDLRRADEAGGEEVDGDGGFLGHHHLDRKSVV